MSNKYSFSTRAIHHGQAPDPSTGAVIVPIYATSTFAQSSPGVHKGYEYSRTKNPTRTAYEECIANLEGGIGGFAFSSGLAASATILDMLDVGSHIIVMDDLYGGTNRLFTKIKNRTSNLEITRIDMSESNELYARLENAKKSNTKLVWVETPSNPMLKIVNLSIIAEFCKKNSLISVCDNTFATPFLQRPIELGIDIVMHSATKYLNGHSDIVSGIVVVGENREYLEQIAFLQNATGAICSPFDSFLALRGLKTLSVRMERHCENALNIAHWLKKNPRVKKVYYPGLQEHLGYETAKKQMTAFGGMISFELAADLKATRRVLESTKIFTLAESLGGIESLIEHPGLMTHASLPIDQKRTLGINDNLIRLSVGIEDYGDLIGDLNQAIIIGCED